ncbi:MAG: S8 family serine peptidase [Ignavibacteriales bacterium]|nr:S8 family serine peptidase [Ignavibacteriales bacterium]
MKVKIFLALMLISITLTFAQEANPTYLSLQQTGVEEFIKANPEYDGRGVIIFIFDTGVDMYADGLEKTSTGEIKVIDVQDFSTQGDIPYYEAETKILTGRDIFLNQEKNYSISASEELSLKPVDKKYYIGVLSEKLFLNSGSGITDLNGDSDNEDKFFFITFLTKGEDGKFWVVYLDKDGDGDVADEQPIRNYRDNQESFVIKDVNGDYVIGFALNIIPEKNILSFHFDDGSHGTHVAGITSGYKIGLEDFNGVAPGAKIISCKLGHNDLAGGATVSESMKKCFLYADKISRETGIPCVVNISFGVGTELEGMADMELFINELVKNNPYLVLCLSNGNEGPGISTSGLPACSPYVFSSGAVLTREIGSSLYSAYNLPQDIILYFSSKGGEVSKPDIISPGACNSTIPPWRFGARSWGTSMSSPYTAGVMALLLSAVQKDYPGLKVPAMLIYKAVRESGTKFDIYSHIDQGGGLINVVNAYKLLKKFIDGGEIDKFESYTTTSFAPNMPNESAPNLYIRNINRVEQEEFIFTVKPDGFNKDNNFKREVILKSDSDWLKLSKEKITLEKGKSTTVSFKIDKSKMKKEGMYAGKILAYRSGQEDMLEFEFWATVVNPYTFDKVSKYKLEKEGKVQPGYFDTYFIQVPDGATSMKISLTPNGRSYVKANYRLHTPDGERIEMSYTLDSGSDFTPVSNIYNDLQPGVYELVVHGHFQAEKESQYKISVEFDGVNLVEDKIIATGENTLDLINKFEGTKSYYLDGEILGYVKEYTVEFNNTDLSEIPFKLNPGESSRKFLVSMSKEDWNKTTDFSLLIFDKDGIAQAKNGLSYKKGDVEILKYNLEGVEDYTLKIIPAFANAPSNLSLNIKEITYFDSPNLLNVTCDGKKSVQLKYNEKTTIKIDFQKPGQDIPSGYYGYGKIYVKASNEENTLAIPVLFKF